jgi:MFS family permease
VAAEVRRPFSSWLALYAASGFFALSLEILWFRLLDVTTRSTAFTFGTLLAIYLFGSATGCLLGARWAPRFGRPLRVFLLCQCGLLAYSGLAVLALVALPPTTPGLSWYHEYWRSGAVFHLGDTWDPPSSSRRVWWSPPSSSRDRPPSARAAGGGSPLGGASSRCLCLPPHSRLTTSGHVPTSGRLRFS